MSSKTSRQLDSSVNRSRRATSGDLTWTVNAVEQYAVPEAHTCDRGKGTRQLRSIHIPRTARRERLNGSQTSAKTTAQIERTAAVAEVQQALLGSVWQRVSKLKRRSAHRRQNKICLPRWTRQRNGWTTLFSLLKCHLERLTCWRLARCKLITQGSQRTGTSTGAIFRCYDTPKSVHANWVRDPKWLPWRSLERLRNRRQLRRAWQKLHDHIAHSFRCTCASGVASAGWNISFCEMVNLCLELFSIAWVPMF